MGWTAHVWKGEGVDQGFLDKAVDALDNTLDSQVSFTISAHDMGEVPGYVIDCDSYGATFGNWKDWLDTTDEVRYGDHHMLVVDCAVLGYNSASEGLLSHEPDTTKWGRSVANAAVALLGPNRFKNTVIHEFSHTCLDESKCPMKGLENGHSCGGVSYGGLLTHLATPMIVGNENDIPDTAQCTASASDAVGWTTDITRCTRNGLESYHRSN